MPFRHLPNSDAQRLSALETARLKWINTAKADRLITDEQYAQLDLSDPNSRYSIYRRDVGESATALALQGQLTTESDTKHAALAQVTSHFIQVFNLGVARGVFQRSDRAFYGLDMNRSDVPPLSSHPDILLWASKLIAGDAARLAATPGATPMAMPGISDVAAASALVDALVGPHSAAKDSYDKEQQDVEADRPGIDGLIADLWDTVEFRLRAESGSSRRRRAREWGIVYLTRPDETPDPDTESTQPTKPAAGTPPEGEGSGGTPS